MAFCTNCGKELNTDSRFCGYCGKELLTVNEVSTQPNNPVFDHNAWENQQSNQIKSFNLKKLKMTSVLWLIIGVIYFIISICQTSIELVAHKSIFRSILFNIPYMFIAIYAVIHFWRNRKVSDINNYHYISNIDFILILAVAFILLLRNIWFEGNYMYIYFFAQEIKEFGIMETIKVEAAGTGVWTVLIMFFGALDYLAMLWLTLSDFIKCRKLGESRKQTQTIPCKITITKTIAPLVLAVICILCSCIHGYKAFSSDVLGNMRGRALASDIEAFATTYSLQKYITYYDDISELDYTLRYQHFMNFRREKSGIAETEPLLVLDKLKNLIEKQPSNKMANDVVRVVIGKSFADYNYNKKAFIELADKATLEVKKDILKKRGEEYKKNGMYISRTQSLYSSPNDNSATTYKYTSSGTKTILDYQVSEDGTKLWLKVDSGVKGYDCFWVPES